jgi:hypothetical protein
MSHGGSVLERATTRTGYPYERADHSDRHFDRQGDWRARSS